MLLKFPDHNNINPHQSKKNDHDTDKFLLEEQAYSDIFQSIPHTLPYEIQNHSHNLM